MHTEIIDIERVFDIQQEHWSRGGPRRTVLGVVASGKRHTNVVVDGWPEVRPRSTVTALFREPGDWKQLVGWVDHTSGEVIAAFPEAPWPASAIACSIVAAWLVFLLSGRWLWAAMFGVKAGLALGTATACLLVGRMIWRTRRTHAERKALESCRQALGQTAAPYPALNIAANKP
jgi:hypothetical protein